MRPHRRQPTRLPRPWDSPGKNTGVGCHFLLQCMKVKSESEVAQSCLTLRDPMDCSLPGSSAHGIFQARVLEWGAIAFSANDTIQITAVSRHLHHPDFNKGRNWDSVLRNWFSEQTDLDLLDAKTCVWNHHINILCFYFRKLQNGGQTTKHHLWSSQFGPHMGKGLGTYELLGGLHKRCKTWQRIHITRKIQKENLNSNKYALNCVSTYLQLSCILLTEILNKFYIMQYV